MAEPVVGVGLLVMGLALFALAWVAYRRRRVMADTPTSKVRALAIGVVEINGVAEPLPGYPPLRARFSGEPCVYWSYRLEEERTRVVTHMVNGKPQTRIEHYWELLASEEERWAFAIRDDTGAVRFDPTSADLPTPASFHATSGGPFPTMDARSALVGGGWPRRLSESRLPVGTPLYVLAEAQRREDAPPDALGSDALVVRRPQDAPFLVSAKGERVLTLQWTIAFWAALLVGLALAGGGVYALTGGA